ncbi:hypothetical protein LOK49_LG15G02251 [Camellia lanceoleosa]|uniref:Uncharacterized protein n=1 Tax=Camellia lanceoleosa TaxID=1840588 RepID=A0ACC0F3I6_9ERIC|nr:hypothetical protein LOK49_LG15G02251 [Camellia lanceoleosa]
MVSRVSACKCSTHDCCSCTSTENKLSSHGSLVVEEVAKVEGIMHNEVASQDDMVSLQKEAVVINEGSGGGKELDNSYLSVAGETINTCMENPKLPNACNSCIANDSIVVI